MAKREPHYTEMEVSKKLTDILSQIGFSVDFIDNNTRVRNPDFVAKKRFDGEEYKIAIELKSNSSIREAITYGIKTLTSVKEVAKFDKLLLLLLNRENIKSFGKSVQDYLKDNPTNIEIINLDDLDRWSIDLQNQLSQKQQNEVFFYVKELSKKLIELIAKNPDNLLHLEWRDLERTVSEMFEGIGFKTTLTPGSKDGGKDVILECTIDKIKKSFIIEIKHWRSGQKVGQKAVKDFIKVIINEKRNKGLYLSTYGYTNNYYERLTEKQKSLIRFGEQEKIVELCKTYEKIRNGIWNPVNSLETVLFENTVNVGE